MLDEVKSFADILHVESENTKGQLREMMGPWIPDEEEIEERINRCRIYPAREEVSDYLGWRVDDLMEEHDARAFAGGMEDAFEARLKRKPYWMYQWSPYICNEKILKAIMPPMLNGIVEWVGITFVSTPGTGKTTKMCYLADEIEKHYGPENIDVIYREKFTEAVDRISQYPKKKVKVLIIDDATQEQHARRSMSEENVKAIKALDIVRHKFEEKIGYTGIIITMFATQRYKGLDLGMRDLTSCYIWSGITSKEDLETLSPSSRTFLTEQERAFEEHDITAKSFGLVTGLGGRPFIMEANHKVAREMLSKLLVEWKLGRSLKNGDGAGREDELIACEHLRQKLKRFKGSKVRHLGGQDHPDIEVLLSYGVNEYVNVKGTEQFRNAVSINFSAEKFMSENKAAIEHGRPFFYLYIIDKSRQLEGIVPVPVNASSARVSRADLFAMIKLPKSFGKKAPKTTKETGISQRREKSALGKVDDVLHRVKVATEQTGSVRDFQSAVLEMIHLNTSLGDTVEEKEAKHRIQAVLNSDVKIPPGSELARMMRESKNADN